MISYNLGFLFSSDLKRVALIKKNQPLWQAGKYNGIGGKKEIMESSLDGMIREFREETGVEIIYWRKFAFLYGTDWLMDVYMSISDDIDKVSTQESEEVTVIDVDKLSDYNVLPNLTWLIPMALRNENIEVNINYL